MKYNNKSYLEFPREFEKYRDLSESAFKLFGFLKELEHLYTDGYGDDWFYRTNEQLCADTGLSINTIKKAKKELLRAGLIETSRGIKYITGHAPKSQPTKYRILI